VAQQFYRMLRGWLKASQSPSFKRKFSAAFRLCRATGLKAAKAASG